MVLISREDSVGAAVKLSSLQKLATLNLTTEQMAGIIEVLTVEIAPLEVSRERASSRQQRYIQRHSNVRMTLSEQREANVDMTFLARVEDNTLPSLTSGKEESKNLPLSPSKPLSSDDPDGFEEFWNVYPKRLRNLDRKAAVKAFNAALKRTDLQTLVDGARAYAADCKADNKIGTEFVKQARSWLNGDCWTEWQPKPQEQVLPSNGKVYVKYGTDAGDAWIANFKAKGKVAPRDSNGGWWFPSEFPGEGATQ